MTTPQEIAAWLRRLPQIEDVYPIWVTIDGQRLPAAFYRQCGQYEAGMQAVQRGERRVGEAYWVQRCYVVGQRPELLQRTKRAVGGCVECAYVLQRTRASDDGDWYVCAYLDQLPAGDRAEAVYQPFGPNFLLGRWDHDQLGQRIDHYDATPRERRPMDVESVTE